MAHTWTTWGTSIRFGLVPQLANTSSIYSTRSCQSNLLITPSVWASSADLTHRLDHLGNLHPVRLVPQLANTSSIYSTRSCQSNLLITPSVGQAVPTLHTRGPLGEPPSGSARLEPSAVALAKCSVVGTGLDGKGGCSSHGTSFTWTTWGTSIRFGLVPQLANTSSIYSTRSCQSNLLITPSVWASSADPAHTWTTWGTSIRFGTA